jgi:hypothetical protein
MSAITFGQFALSVPKTFQIVLLLGATVMVSFVTIRGRLRHDHRRKANRFRPSNRAT